MFFWWHHWPHHRKGWGTVSICEPVWHWFTFHLNVQAAPQPDSSHLPRSSGGPSGLSPSKPRPPSQMQSSLQKERTESLRWTPGQKDRGLNDKRTLVMPSLMEQRGRDVKLSTGRSRFLTWVLASRSCWKPSTSLLSSAALSWINNHQSGMKPRPRRELHR